MSEKWVLLVIDRTTPFYNFNNSGLGRFISRPVFNDSLNDSLNHCIKEKLSVDAYRTNRDI
jgi:hypothetical protein